MLFNDRIPSALNAFRPTISKLRIRRPTRKESSDTLGSKTNSLSGSTCRYQSRARTVSTSHRTRPVPRLRFLESNFSSEVISARRTSITPSEKASQERRRSWVDTRVQPKSRKKKTPSLCRVAMRSKARHVGWPLDQIQFVTRARVLSRSVRHPCTLSHSLSLFSLLRSYKSGRKKSTLVRLVPYQCLALAYFPRLWGDKPGVCVCVCVRERERESARDSERERENERAIRTRADCLATTRLSHVSRTGARFCLFLSH